MKVQKSAPKNLFLGLKQSHNICVKSNDLNAAATGNIFSCNNKPGFNKTDTSSGMSEHIVQKVILTLLLYGQQSLSGYQTRKFRH